MRGLELLKVGGKLSYSTCSLNPIAMLVYLDLNFSQDFLLGVFLQLKAEINVRLSINKNKKILILYLNLISMNLPAMKMYQRT